MAKLILTDERFPVRVNGSLSFQQMIAAARFIRVAEQIMAVPFLVKTNQVQDLDVSVAIVDGTYRLSTEEVLGGLAELNKRPLRIEELLALAALLQNGRLRLSAIALGSLWSGPSGEVYVPSCRLSTIRSLRFGRIAPEPAWRKLWDCFPCAPLST